jgi:hypothetical protein
LGLADLSKLDADADRLLASKLKFDVSGVELHAGKVISHEGYGPERSHRLKTVHEDSGKGDDDARTSDTTDRDASINADKSAMGNSSAKTASVTEQKAAVEDKESGRKEGRGLSFVMAPLPKISSVKLVDSSVSSPADGASSKPAGQPDSPKGGGKSCGGDNLDRSDIDEEIEYDDDFEDLADAEDAPEPAARSGSSGAQAGA